MTEDDIRRIVREEIERGKTPTPAETFERLRREAERQRAPFPLPFPRGTPQSCPRIDISITYHG